MRLISCVVTVLGLAAVTASAAVPEAGGHYEGSTTQNLQARLAMSGTDTISVLRIAWRAPKCQLAKNGTQGTTVAKNVRLGSDDSFARRVRASHKLPATKAFSGGTQIEHSVVRGHFTSSTKVTGTLRITVDVRNRAGVVIDHCTTAHAVRWTASFLGTTYSIPS